MPPKRKAPLAIADSNVPPSKKTTRGKAAAEKVASARALSAVAQPPIAPQTPDAPSVPALYEQLASLREQLQQVTQEKQTLQAQLQDLQSQLDKSNSDRVTAFAEAEAIIVELKNSVGALLAAKANHQVSVRAATHVPLDKVYKYSNANTVIDQEPLDVTFFMWPKDEDDAEDEEKKEEEEELLAPYKDPIPKENSLQAILDRIETEKSVARQDAFTAHMKEHGFVCSSDVERIHGGVDPPFDQRQEIVRNQFVKDGLMTESEANAIKPMSEEDRKTRAEDKMRYQNSLNFVQREHNAALKKVSDDASLTAEDKSARIAKVDKKFLKRKADSKEWFGGRSLSKEETDAMKPNIEYDEAGNEIPKPKTTLQLKKEAEEKAKEAAEKAFVPPRMVTEKGLPITMAGMEKRAEICKEIDKRDPDDHQMYIYNDFAGYGVAEVIANLASEFNEMVFKKDVSPIKKWTFVEGVTMSLHMDGHMTWMMIDDPDMVKDGLNILGIMFVTALEILHESDLIGRSPLPDNIGIMTLLFLNFMLGVSDNYRLTWYHEVVRAADAYGVDLIIPEGKKISITEKQLEKWRTQYKKKAAPKTWVWKTKFNSFKRDNPGGSHFDITKMPEAKKNQYRFKPLGGAKSGSDSDSDD